MCICYCLYDIQNLLNGDLLSVPIEEVIVFVENLLNQLSKYSASKR